MGLVLSIFKFDVWNPHMGNMYENMYTKYVPMFCVYKCVEIVCVNMYGNMYTKTGILKLRHRKNDKKHINESRQV